ncbi:FAD-dependent monooxygenase [Microbacterium ulmi]|uniref:FAD-dependent oxidoreductase n=1 Tax=Microbacterium ulmi TaxID=179095 RepID=A0A7Y2Q2G4_9MICO|nr:FAD-dependent monooxygenase [Microbacterium ulmi]NII69982.1 2-polyprenyl-6-methoxyphenol hydroxylase-like FAD-dependent oxidoreductase [Microbacterium ulmi]NNH04588.1 FAD-dependent oxidoreductase [Microbacterium ulmi]
MSAVKILISGASIAGPALARWLGRNGFDVTVVEKSAAVRAGGQAVDFKGRTHKDVLTRMGVLDDVHAAQTSKTDWRLVDEADRVKAVMPGEFIGGDIEILRGDLAAILHRHSAADVEYVFGDEIVSLHDSPRGVDVEFAHRTTERFDLVIGADGVHSAVRRLAFGPEQQYVQPSGHYYAVASGAVPLDGLETQLPDGRGVAYAYSAPGRLAVVGGQKAPSLFVFQAGSADYDRHDTASQLTFLRRGFAGVGWRVPAMLDAAHEASDFYLDALTRTRMRSFTRGRVALVGDAGYANTLGGFGTGLALVGAYVLAGELVAARGDHAAALAAYDRRMVKPTRIARSGSAGSFLAPPSEMRIRLRDWTFANRAVLRTMMWMTDAFATDDAIPDYRLR